MPSSVQFAVTAGDTYLRRTTSVPSLSAFTWCTWIKIVDNPYLDFGDYFALENIVSEYFYLESDSTGTLYIITRQGTGVPSRTTNIWTDGRNGWQFLAVTCDGTTARVYHRGEADASLTLVSHTLVDTPMGPSRVSMAALDLFPTDSTTTNRYAGVKMWTSTLTQAELLAESGALTPVITSNLSFANDMQSAATCQNDQSGTGGNFTKTGTPTDNADTPTLNSGPIDVDAGTDTPAVSDSVATSLAYAKVLADSISVTSSSSLEVDTSFSTDVFSISDSLLIEKLPLITNDVVGGVYYFID